MKESLFKEFPEVTAEQWKQQIQSDLNGADFDEKLVFKSLDGINVQPFYTSEDIKGSIQLPPPKSWNICERIYVRSTAEANQQALEVLEKGAESLWFIIPSEEMELQELFRGLDAGKTTIYLSLQFLSEDYFLKLKDFLNDKAFKVYLQTDIIGNLSRTGNWFYSEGADFAILERMALNSSNFRSVFSVDASLYQNAGANIPQQLAWSLSHLNEYLNYFYQKGIKIENLEPQFIVAAGSNYFFEIAKIRALRWLYSTLAADYGLPGNCHILAQPGRRDKTLYDYNVNLLRTTTQCMSAILGGADTVQNLPYDNVFHKNSEFGERIARNQLLVMKHEAYLNKIANVADGSYYIESLTRMFATNAFEVFKELEKEGGFLKHLKTGSIQQETRTSAEKEQQLFDKGQLILVGTNKFANPQDTIEAELEVDPFVHPTSGNTAIEPFLEKRLSEKLEQERLQKEAASRTLS